MIENVIFTIYTIQLQDSPLLNCDLTLTLILPGDPCHTLQTCRAASPRSESNLSLDKVIKRQSSGDCDVIQGDPNL